VKHYRTSFIKKGLFLWFLLDFVLLGVLRSLLIDVFDDLVRGWSAMKLSFTRMDSSRSCGISTRLHNVFTILLISQLLMQEEVSPMRFNDSSSLRINWAFRSTRVHSLPSILRQDMHFWKDPYMKINIELTVLTFDSILLFRLFDTHLRRFLIRTH
jgi:hypothetical protein